VGWSVLARRHCAKLLSGGPTQPMPCHVIDTIASVFTAIGTVAVAILAIWGDQIKDRLLGPRLGLSLVSAKGDLTRRGDGSKVYYYHLRVTNQKGRNAARGTRVVMQAFSRRAPSGRFVISPLVYPLQLVWTPFEAGETERLVTDESFCDLGYVGEFEKIFRLAAIATPNNFSGSVEKDALCSLRACRYRTKRLVAQTRRVRGILGRTVD